MKKRFRLSSTQTILLVFLCAILLGSVLLALPISSADSLPVPYIDALFTSATSVCVTGLVTIPTVTSWSIFGQIVILLLIQAGGLGIITVMTGVLIGIHRKIGIGERMLIQDAFNLQTLSGLVRFIRKVLIGTFLVEGIGALLCMTVFVPEYGVKGIWISVFHSVSAFCNAGLDILSESSLCDYALHPVVNITTILLIVLGGIGYIVWWDFGNALKHFREQKFRCFRSLTLHSKIALSSTLILILGGAVLFLLFEYNNPKTIGNFPLPGKIMASVFQSVTTRTAGFATISQKGLTSASCALSLLLMFIGGSPAGTAGGVKTVTITVLLASAFSTIKNKKDASLFRRTIPKPTVSKAVAVIVVSFLTMFFSTIILAAFTDSGIGDVLFETVSATATVGLTRDLTPTLGTAEKIVVLLTMYLGRVGPISLFVAFNTRKPKDNLIKNPTEQISVG